MARREIKKTRGKDRRHEGGTVSDRPSLWELKSLYDGNGKKEMDPGR